jgi:hypothetical protein
MEPAKRKAVRNVVVAARVRNGDNVRGVNKLEGGATNGAGATVCLEN